MTKKAVRKKTTRPLVGVYPGTFDPVTLGHMDIISRALKIVDHLIVAVADSPAKEPLFSVDRRVDMITAELKAQKSLAKASWSVLAFDELLMKFVEKHKARVIIRGLRAVSDFEYEFQMAGMNGYLNQDIETVFLMAQDRHQFVSSRFVKEIARLEGDVDAFVSPRVAKILKKRFTE